MSATTTSPTARLRPGRSELTRGQVDTVQRTRMIAAALEVIDDVGYAQMTVAHVITRARISRKTFYDLFTDREHCFLAAYEHTLTHARQVALAAYATQPTWRAGIRSALDALLNLMDESPAAAKIVIVESLSGGEEIYERRTALINELAGAIDQGRYQRGALNPPPVTAEGIVGGILAVLHRRLLENTEEPLGSLLGPLMSMIVLPYLGTAAARKEAAKEPTQPRQHKPPTPPARVQDPFAGLNMRLTYRTVLVLSAMRTHPGASNRGLATAAGVIDQGQISKLLGRLARLGLAENLGAGPTRGCSNAWHLTARGAQVEQATRPH